MDGFSLKRVTAEYYDSIASYRREMIESKSSFDGTSNLDKYNDIEKWHLNVLLFERPETLPPGYSLAFEYVFLHDSEVVGMVNIRPDAMNHPYLKRFGGHIGYSIRPSRRMTGIGTLMLKYVLEVCKNEFHMEKVMITCLEDNEGSRRIIMNNGGVFENKILYPPEDKMIERYWITL